jgi:hypothetical protein
MAAKDNCLAERNKSEERGPPDAAVPGRIFDRVGDRRPATHVAEANLK